MQLGLRVTPCAPPQDLERLIVSAEAAGFDYVGLPDSQLLFRDVWVALTVAAQATTTIRLGTHVTNPVTRDATVTASAAAALDELSSGRFELGIGTGYSSVQVTGGRRSTVADLRRYVTECRDLWAGTTVHRDGAAFRLHGSPATVPVHVAAGGPKMLRTAGEIGDGVIHVGGLSESWISHTMELVDEGARARGRSVTDLDVMAPVFAYVTDDVPVLLERLRPFAALWAVRNRSVLADHGVDVSPPQGWQAGIYPDVSHAENWDEAIEASQWLPEDALASFVEESCILGSGEQVASRLRQLDNLGVTTCVVRGVSSYEMPWEVVASFEHDVLPHLRTA